MASAAASSSSLRQSILSQALPLIRTHSFTKQALLTALTQIEPSTSNSSSSPFPPSLLDDPLELSKKESILNTLFGSGLGPEKALVDAWEAKGLEGMRAVKSVDTGKRGRERRLEDVLENRLRFTTETTGEHIVQGLAILSAPSTTLPPLQLPESLSLYISEFSFPPAYLPPSPFSPSGSQSTGTPESAPRVFSLPVLNPLGMMKYGFKIADEALWLVEEDGDAPGGGMDWYAKRLAISAIYLRAESRLLVPDADLSKAVSQLQSSLSRYHSLEGLGSIVDADVRRQVGEFGMFVWNSWGGLFRSRGWIR